MIRRHESSIWTGASLLFLAAAFYVAVFTDNSYTVYGVATVTFAAMSRIATLQRRFDEQERYWAELIAALRSQLTRD